MNLFRAYKVLMRLKSTDLQGEELRISCQYYSRSLSFCCDSFGLASSSVRGRLSTITGKKEVLLADC